MPSPNLKPVITYIPPEEKAHLDNLTRRTGLSLSKLVRRLIKGQKLPDPVKMETTEELIRLRADLARLGNLFKLALDHEEVQRTQYNAGRNLEDLDIANIEIGMVQDRNHRATEKTYHLMVSFRDEKPSLEASQDIAKEMAKALGYQDHQYVAGTHHNTNNYHMHIAFNKIHPKTWKAHSPSFDYLKLDKCARAMELKWGLKVDKSILENDKKNAQPSKKARDYEAISWEQSFDSYVRERKSQIMGALKKSRNWQDLHKALRNYHIEIKPRANGLVISSLDGKHAMKASALDRAFGKPSLEKMLGQYQAPDAQTTQSKPKSSRYQRKPRFVHKDQADLWKRFIKKTTRKERLNVKAFNTWREFLTYEALSDPLAMMILLYNKRMVKTAKAITQLPKVNKQSQETVL